MAADPSAEQALVAFLASSGGEWLVADCDAALVARLRDGDHHVVTVGARPALLLTYHLWSEPLPARPRAFVLFRYVDGHPPAPDDLQRLVDALAFRRP